MIKITLVIKADSKVIKTGLWQERASWLEDGRGISLVSVFWEKFLMGFMSGSKGQGWVRLRPACLEQREGAPQPQVWGHLDLLRR